MRLRLGDWWTAGRKRAVELGAIPDPREDTDGNWAQDYLADLSNPAVEAAQPGDVWRVVWTGPGSWQSGVPSDDPRPLAGFVITCPVESCPDAVHLWVSADNCSCKIEGGSCCHDGVGSCWTWTGSAVAGTLTANPSLFASGAQCKWHGWLRDGVMSPA